MRIAKKYFSFHGLDRKKAGLKRVRIAKKIHSSLLRWASAAPGSRSEGGAEAVRRRLQADVQVSRYAADNCFCSSS